MAINPIQLPQRARVADIGGSILEGLRFRREGEQQNRLLDFQEQQAAALAEQRERQFGLQEQAAESLVTERERQAELDQSNLDIAQQDLLIRQQAGRATAAELERKEQAKFELEESKFTSQGLLALGNITDFDERMAKRGKFIASANAQGFRSGQFEPNPTREQEQDELNTAFDAVIQDSGAKTTRTDLPGGGTKITTDKGQVFFRSADNNLVAGRKAEEFADAQQELGDKLKLAQVGKEGIEKARIASNRVFVDARNTEIRDLKKQSKDRAITLQEALEFEKLIAEGKFDTGTGTGFLSSVGSLIKPGIPGISKPTTEQSRLQERFDSFTKSAAFVEAKRGGGTMTGPDFDQALERVPNQGRTVETNLILIRQFIDKNLAQDERMKDLLAERKAGFVPTDAETLGGFGGVSDEDLLGGP